MAQGCGPGREGMLELSVDAELAIQASHGLAIS